MHPFIAKTLGGLSREYYFRQLFFGAIIAALLGWMMFSTTGVKISVIIYLGINMLLYPYSRFVYESIIDFILGNNVFFGNAYLMVFGKMMMMLICFMFGIFIAPIGLLYLYFHHSKTEKHEQ